MQLLDLTAHPYTDSPERAAKALYEVLRAEAKALGQDPDIEVSIRSPSENARFPDHHGGNLPAQWAVFWEAAPDPDWGIRMVNSLHGVEFPNAGYRVRMWRPDPDAEYGDRAPLTWHGEPFWGGDVHFVPE